MSQLVSAVRDKQPVPTSCHFLPFSVLFSCPFLSFRRVFLIKKALFASFWCSTVRLDWQLGHSWSELNKPRLWSFWVCGRIICSRFSSMKACWGKFNQDLYLFLLWGFERDGIILSSASGTSIWLIGRDVFHGRVHSYMKSVRWLFSLGWLIDSLLEN